MICQLQQPADREIVEGSAPVVEQGQQPARREMEGGSAPVVEQGLQPAQPAHRGWAASNTCRETLTCIKHMCIVGPKTGAGWAGQAAGQPGEPGEPDPGRASPARQARF